MKKNFLIVIGVFVLLVSCELESDEDKTPEEMIVGTWMIQSTELLAQVVPGNGSYLEFKECLASCDGVDYMASDGTSGTFTYGLNESATIIEIVDETPDGGGYNGTWDILELTNNRFRIAGETLLGTMKIEMTKQ